MSILYVYSYALIVNYKYFNNNKHINKSYLIMSPYAKNAITNARHAKIIHALHALRDSF